MIGTAYYNTGGVAYLGHVGLQEQLEVIMDNTLTDRIDIGKSVSSSFEGEKPNEVDNLCNENKFIHRCPRYFIPVKI